MNKRTLLGACLLMMVSTHAFAATDNYITISLPSSDVLLCSESLGVTATPQATGLLFNEMAYTHSKTIFRLNAPSKPTLRLYDAGRGGKPRGSLVWEETLTPTLAEQ